MGEITQGSIILGIRSPKYPEVSCYGIIITARCDVANCKVSKLYYLIGVKACEWFSTEVGYSESYKDKIRSCEDQLEKSAKAMSLDPVVLQRLSDSDCQSVVKEQKGKEQPKKSLLDAIKSYKLFCQSAIHVQARTDAIKTHSKPAVDFLKKCSKGDVFHFAFLPNDAYCKRGTKQDGIIIDLQEIESLSLEDAERIQSPGIDHMILADYDSTEQARLRARYWLESKDDFVLEEATITSPWIEYLMQRFSHSFIRIGVDGATDDDCRKLVGNIGEKGV